MIIYDDLRSEQRKIYRAVVYIRFSSHKQADSYSIEYQQEECLKYLERKGYKFIKFYIDEAKSGKKTAGREALEQMLFDAGRNIFDKIIVFSFSRSFRNTRDALNTNHELMTKHGIPIESVIEPIDLSSPHGKFSGTNLFAMHELQSDITAAHVRSGMHIAAKQGYYLGGYVPFGYELYETEEFTRGKARKKYRVNEAEAEIIRDIFKMYANDYSLNYIQKEMKRRGVYARKGNIMSIQTMCRILRNPFYIGTREYEIKGYEKLFLENAVPAIIDKEIWDFVQKKHETNALPKPRKTKRLYALTGKIYCGCCNRHFFGVYKGESRYENIEGYSYYVCSTKKTYGTCEMKNIRKDQLERYCISQIKKHILTPEKIKEIAAYIVSQADASPDLVIEEFDIVNKRKRKVLDIIKSMKKDMYEMDEAEQEAQKELIAEYSKELTELNERIARLESLEQNAISSDIVEAYLNDLLLKIDSTDVHILKSVFDKLIERIVIHDDKVELFLVVFPFTHNRDYLPQGQPHWTLCSEVKRDELA